MSDTDDWFELFDLRVEVVAPPGARILCSQKVGDYFEVEGELLRFQPDMPFSLYNLAAVIPLLPAKQRPYSQNDWMSTDSEVACADPACPSRLRITRTNKRRFRHSETSGLPLERKAT